MDFKSVLTTENLIEADGACAELRAHDIKCNTFSGDLPGMQLPSWYTGAQPDLGIRVLVAPEDEERAKKILDGSFRNTGPGETRSWHVRGSGEGSTPKS